MENTHRVFFMLVLLGCLQVLTATGSIDYDTAQHRGDIYDSPSQAVGATGLGFSGIEQRHDGYVKGETPTIPKTSFTCSAQPYNPGLYADMETQCQVYHVCFGDRQESFLCGPGTNFNQKILACDFWYNFDCQDSPSFYTANADIGKIPEPYRPTGEQSISRDRTKITQQPVYPEFPRDEQKPITTDDHIRPRPPVQPPRVSVVPQPPRVSVVPQPPHVSVVPQPPRVSVVPQPPRSPQPQTPKVQPQPPIVSYPPPPRVSYPPPRVSYPPPRVSYPPPRVSYPPPPRVSEPPRVQEPAQPPIRVQPPPPKVRPPPAIQQQVHTEYDFEDTKPPSKPFLPPPPPPSRPASPPPSLPPSRPALPPPPPPRVVYTTSKPVFPPVVSPPRISRPPVGVLPPSQPVRPQFPTVSDHPSSDIKGSTGYRPQEPQRIPQPSRPIDTSYPSPRPGRPSPPPFQQEHVEVDYVPLPPRTPPPPPPSRPTHQERVPPPPRRPPSTIQTEYVPPPPPPRLPPSTIQTEYVPPPPPPRRPPSTIQTEYVPPRPPPRRPPATIQTEYVPPPPPPPPRRPPPTIQTEYVPPPPKQPPVIIQQEEYVPPPPPPPPPQKPLRPVLPPVSPSVISVQQKPQGPPARPSVTVSVRPQQPPPLQRPRPVFPPATDHPNANIKGGPGYQQPPPQPPRFEPTRIGTRPVTVPRQPPSDSSRFETSRVKTPPPQVSTGYKPSDPDRVKQPSIPDRGYEPPRKIPSVSVVIPPPRPQTPSFPPPRPQVIDHPSANIKGGPTGIPQPPRIQSPTSPVGIKRPESSIAYEVKPSTPSRPTTGIKTTIKTPGDSYKPPLPYPPSVPTGGIKVPSTPDIQQIRPQFPAPRPQPIDHPNANIKGGPGYQPPRPQQPVIVPQVPHQPVRVPEIPRPVISQPPTSPSITSQRTKTVPRPDTSTGRGFQTPPKRPDYPKVDEIYPPAVQQVHEPPRKPLSPAAHLPPPVSTVKQTTSIKQPIRGPSSSAHRVSVKTKQPQPDYITGSSYKRGSETYPKPEFQQPAYPSGQPAHPSGQPAHPSGQPAHPSGQPAHPSGIYQPPIATPSRASDLSIKGKRPPIQSTSHDPASQFPAFPGVSVSHQTRQPAGSHPAEYPYREVPGHQPPHQRQVFPHRDNPDHPNESIKGSGAYRPPPPVDFQPAASEVNEQKTAANEESQKEASKLGDTGTE